MRRILVAEDDPSTREVLVELLQMEGYEVHAVSNGVSALVAADKVRPHLCILDVMMPGRDGVSVLQHLRSQPETQELPVIILTAKGDPASTWAGWRAGCDYYMSKPFDPDELLTAVERLVSQQVRA